MNLDPSHIPIQRAENDLPCETRKFSSFARKLQEIFSADLRSLALFRIGLATVFLVDLAIRWTEIRIFYTDFGLLPRAVLIEKFINPWAFSINLINGTTLAQWILFSLAALSGLGMLIGYRTRLTTFLTWFFLVSLHSRNHVILQGGDVYIRLLLFWSMFVPLNGRYSVDAALDTSERRIPNRYYSIGTAALFFQVALIYAYTAAFKWTGPEWHDGTAVFYALSLDYFRTPIGDILLQYPGFLKILTHYVLWFEVIGPFLLFSPFLFVPLRMLVIVAIIALHIGLRSCMELGPFPWTSIVAISCLLPRWFWEKTGRVLTKPAPSATTIYFDADCGFCKKSVYLIRTFLFLPNTTIATCQSDEAILNEMKIHNSWVVKDHQDNRHTAFRAFIALCEASPVFRFAAPLLKLSWIERLGHRIYRYVSNNRSFFGGLIRPFRFRPMDIRLSARMSAWAVFSLLAVFVWIHSNLYHTRFLGPNFLRTYALILRLDQSWSMFAPSPSRDDGWFVIPGNLRDGTTVDLFTKQSPVNWERPERLQKMYWNERWRKYMSNLHSRKYKAYRLYYAQYLCRDWNEKNSGSRQLNDLEIIFMHERIGPDFVTAPAKPLKLLKHNCFEAPKK